MLVNRFLNKDIAYKMFEKVQIHALKKREEDDMKIGLLVHQKRIIARYGRLDKINQFLENVQIALKDYQKILGMGTIKENKSGNLDQTNVYVTFDYNIKA